jgi:catechol 2,3-dioxygenase-like lactoylglutathione lyase family enzyme
VQTKGINPLALMCRDMAETVKFYTEALRMPLVKTVALPDGGQHFFFDCGGGSLLATYSPERGPSRSAGSQSA